MGRVAGVGLGEPDHKREPQAATANIPRGAGAKLKTCYETCGAFAKGLMTPLTVTFVVAQNFCTSLSACSCVCVCVRMCVVIKQIIKERQ